VFLHSKLSNDSSNPNPQINECRFGCSSELDNVHFDAGASNVSSIMRVPYISRHSETANRSTAIRIAGLLGLMFCSHVGDAQRRPTNWGRDGSTICVGRHQRKTRYSESPLLHCVGLAGVGSDFKKRGHPPLNVSIRWTYLWAMGTRNFVGTTMNLFSPK
jgi:hypothetical protein